MFIFALISMGVIYTMISSLSFVRDSNARSAATNLASQEIDRARSVTNVFLVTNKSFEEVVDGRKYTVKTVAEWVSDPAKDVPCGAAGEPLKYKRVNVTVSWPGMANASNTVRSDTLIAPRERVSDPDQGTILVSVLDSKPSGLSGVTITTVPAQEQPSVTDSQGCGYVLNVKPGSYTVTVSKPGYVSVTQKAVVTTDPITIEKRNSINLPFQLEKSELLKMELTPAAVVPRNLDFSLLHSSDPVIYYTATSAVKTREEQLYPFADGYTALAGRYADKSSDSLGCLSPNPVAWPESTDDGVNYAAVPARVVTPPITVPIAMGTVAVRNATSSDLYLTAVSQPSAPAGVVDPGCGGVTMTYKFGQVVKKGASTAISLPFGTWKLYLSTSNGSLGSVVKATELTTGAPSRVTPAGADGIVTLDPRTVAP